jgi:hypothetical protein
MNFHPESGASKNKELNLKEKEPFLKSLRILCQTAGGAPKKALQTFPGTGPLLHRIKEKTGCNFPMQN